MFNRLDHLVVAVNDLEGAAKAWEQNLGLRVEKTLEPEGAALRLATLPTGDAFLELAQPVGSGGRFAERVKQQGQGLFSLSIEVDDLAAAVAYLKGRGVEVSTPEQGVWPGTRIARLNRGSAHGVSIQLIQRM